MFLGSSRLEIEIIPLLSVIWYQGVIVHFGGKGNEESDDRLRVEQLYAFILQSYRDVQEFDPFRL